jgi:hypothetical protein
MTPDNEQVVRKAGRKAASPAAPQPGSITGIK